MHLHQVGMLNACILWTEEAVAIFHTKMSSAAASMWQDLPH